MEFVCNHKKYFQEASLTTDLNKIYNPNSQYRGTIPVEKWMNGSVAGPIAARLYNVVLYIYSEKEGETNRTFVYRPCGSHSETEGYIALMKRDRTMVDGHLIRLWCKRGNHYNWLAWGPSDGMGVKTEEERNLEVTGEGTGNKTRSAVDLGDSVVASWLEGTNDDVGRGEGTDNEAGGAADLGGDRAVARVGEVEETNEAVASINGGDASEFEDFRPYAPTVILREWWE